MKLFSKAKKHFDIPSPYTAEDVKIETSICTGERTIGFYDKTLKMLMYAELVRSDSDIAEFYEKYKIF